MEEYENLVAAIAHIDAAISCLETCGQSDVDGQLTDLRNDLNTDRLALLGNGQKPPYFVGDLMAQAGDRGATS